MKLDNYNEVEAWLNELAGGSDNRTVRSTLADIEKVIDAEVIARFKAEEFHPGAGDILGTEGGVELTEELRKQAASGAEPMCDMELTP